MKFHTVAWSQFFAALPLYLGMPVGARQFFVYHVRPSQPIPNTQMGEWRQALCNSGLLLPGRTGVNATVRPEYREFWRTLRGMSESQVFDSPILESFLLYLGDAFTTEELGALDNSRNLTRGNYEGLQSLFSNVTASAWPRAFLAATNVDWEKKYHSGSEAFFTSPTPVLAAAQQVLRCIAKIEEEQEGEGGGPVHFARLPELCRDIEPARLAAALRAVFRYLLVFAGLSDELEPVIGLWPGLASRLSSKPVKPPAAVEVSQPFHAMFLMDDMVAVLSAAVLEPIRLRSGDRNIFEAHRQTLRAALAALPAWLEEAFHLTIDDRIEEAIDYLLAFEFLRQTGRPGSSFRFEATESGIAWLSRSAKERLKDLFDRLLADRAEESRYRIHHLQLIPSLGAISSGGNIDHLRKGVFRVWQAAPVDVWLRLGDFLEFHGRTNNALATAAGRNDRLTLTFRGRYIHNPNEDELNSAWQRVLHSFLTLRLFPFGGVKLGVESGGKAICFAMTPVGSYLLGDANDFELASAETRFLIQPNFDIVFLAPSPTLEAELSRFAERKGRHVGTLFRITKASVLAAVAAGATAEQLLATLRDHSQTGVPPNVQAEIVGWTARYRQVDIRPAVLIHCPDEDTATRVGAALGKSASRIGPTLLEFHQEKIPPSVVKKLRDAGVFIRAAHK